MPQSLATFDSALKEDYGPGLRNAVNNANVILTEAQRNEDDIVGRRAVWSVHTSRSASTGARAELGSLPTAGNQAYSEPVQALKYIYHTIKVSGQAIALTRNDTGAFRRALEAEMDGAEKDIKVDVSRQIFGQASAQTGSPMTARSGILAWAAASSSTTVIPLATSASGQASAVTNAEFRYFFVGEKVDIVNVLTGVVVDAGVTITAITGTVSGGNPSLTGTTTTTRVLGTHAVVRAGTYDNEMPGLRQLIATNSLDQRISGTAVLVHGLSSDVQAPWASVSVGGTTSPISEDLIEQAFDKVVTDGDGGAPTLIVGGFEQRRALANKLQAQKRYDGREMTLTAGWRGLNVARGIYVADRFCPDNDAFLLNTGELAWFVGQDFTWDEVDGRVLFKALDGTDAYEARMKAYVTIAATNRNSHCRLQFQPV